MAAMASPTLAQVAGPAGRSSRTVDPNVVEQTGTTWQGVTRVGVVIGLIVIPLILGALLAKKLKMPDHGWKFALAIGSLAAAAVLVATGEIKLGPDLSGGITLIYELEETGQRRAEARPSGDAQDADQQQALDDAYGGMNRDEKVAALIKALQERVDPSGTKEVTIRKYGEGQIEIIIPQAEPQELEYIERRIYTAGALEFRIVASPNFSEHQSKIDVAERLPPGRDIVRIGEREVARWVPYDDREFGDVDQARQRGLVTRMSGKTPQALVLTDDGLDVTGEYLRNASPDVDETGRPQVSFTFDSQGAFKFGQLTGSHVPNRAGQRYSLGILLDNRLLSAPTIESKITDRGRISGGSMNQDEVDFVVGILNAGSLPAALNKTPISRAQISPTLGAQTIQNGQWAMGITMALVAIFMTAYYRFAGLVAVFAVAANLLLVLGAMVLIKGAFTMPGLAGLVLTIGMAVDSNVLIYERIREELQRGSALRMAIRNGYARAWITIFDSHLTTIMTGVVLYKIAPDSVKGFGVTLVLGILINLYTAVFMTRIIFDVAERRHWLKKLSMAQWIRDPNVDFVGLQKYCIAASLLVVAACIAGIVWRGEDLLDIDFTGGSSVEMVLDDDNKMEYAKVQEAISATPLAGSTLVEMDNSRKRYTLTTINPDVIEVERILTEAFKGKLETYRVEVSDLKPIAGEPAAADASDVGALRTPMFFAGIGSPLNVAVMLQDAGADAAPAEQSTEEPTTEDDAEDAPAAPPESAPATESSSDATDEDTDIEADPFAGGAEAHITFGASGQSEAAAGIDHAALENLVKDALAAAGHETSNFSLSNPEYEPGSIRNFTEWDVKLALPQDEARVVLDKLQEETNSQPVFPLSNKIGGRVANQMAAQAIAATVLCCLGLIGFLWFRFHGVMYGIAAVIALLFDIVIVIGAVALSALFVDMAPGLASALMIDKFKLDLTLVAALLTLVGYCINDTIVVFDRIREVKGKSPRLTGDMINASINQTLSRTLLTGLTTIGSVIVLYIVGGEGIHGFAFALFIGFIVGTFGSIFIASPLLLWLTQRADAASDRSGSKAA
jgi:SecD/SecF fusion protein